MKKIQMIFLLIGMAVCLIPFAGMAFRPTNETTENRTMTEFPSLKAEGGGLNRQFPGQFEKWFNEHFAFRNELVSADSKIMGTVFQTSAVDSVIYGTDDWLYYRSTLGDYQGTNRMNSRELYNLEHNLSIVKEWTEDKKVELLLTVPPNKNTIYGEHMPYYMSTIVDPAHTVDELPALCDRIGLNYADLVQLFREQKEVLYLKRDSHWNNKGALLAYNEIMGKTGRQFETYEDASASRSADTDGDMNRMLYTFYGEKEMNYSYNISPAYSYVTDTKSVEDAWIETTVPGKEGTLVMFRDSFGNTLLPFVADQFGKAYFSKESPYRLQKVVEEQKPDLLIIEKVERNLRDFIEKPPVLNAPSAELPQDISKEHVSEGELDLKCRSNSFDPDFLELSGMVPEKLISNDTEILLEVDGRVVKAYHTDTNGFIVYLEKMRMKSDAPKVKVFLKKGEAATEICETTILPEQGN